MVHLNGFDANQVDPNEPMQPVPAGTYLATIVATERKDTKSGTGQYLEVAFQIQEGQHKGRKVLEKLNLWNANDTSKKIAWGDMSAICRAVGVMQPNDSTDIHNIPLEIVVGCKNPNAEGRIYNEIKCYRKRGMMQQAAPAPSPAQQQQAATGERPPWMG